MSQVVNNAGVRHQTTRTKVELTRIYAAEFQKAGTLTAELKQEVITTSFYPSKKVETSMQNGLFSTSDFGFDEQVFTNTETRYAWVPVPEGATEDQVKQMLEKANANGAVIYKVLDNEPILDESQLYSISIGQRTLADFANRQVVRYPKDHGTMPEQICLVNNKVQYRKTYFWNSAKGDVDNRGKGKVYVSPELTAELEGVQAVAQALTGQIISDGTELMNGAPATNTATPAPVVASI